MQFIFQKKLLIFSIIFFIFSCFVFLLLYRNINNNKEMSQLAQKEWQMKATSRENTKLLINSIKAIEKERTLLETYFVQSSDIVPFLNMIEKLAKKVGAKAEITSVKITEEKSSLIVKMKALGSFEIIYKLIILLENSPYDLNFVLVDIQTSDTSVSKIPQWVANFQIKLLSFIN